MPLPLSLGQSGGASVGRAQNFSTSKLMQHTQRAQATTSIGRAMNHTMNNKPTTSIAHPSGAPEGAQTSALRKKGDKRTTSLGRPAEEANEERENNRYDYMMRQRMRKKRHDRAEAKRGFGRKLTGDASKKSKNYINRMVERHEKKHGLTVDADAKKMMKMELKRAGRRGDLNTNDLGEMEKMVDKL
ncbi:MAG: hypothetical protein HOE53_00900 [Candidatus Magasanikbacteria bacterium]|nr:hypothetical protein [Candidatus Magasanikbacteria bacterium]